MILSSQQAVPCIGTSKDIGRAITPAREPDMPAGQVIGVNGGLI